MSTQTQRQTRVGHCRQDDTDVYIGRGHGQANIQDTEPPQRGWLGNPFTTDQYAREEAIRLYRLVFVKKLRRDPEFKQPVAQLQGQILGCWCQRLDDDEPACHGEVVAEWADRLGGEADG